MRDGWYRATAIAPFEPHDASELKVMQIHTFK